MYLVLKSNLYGSARAAESFLQVFQPFQRCRGVVFFLPTEQCEPETDPYFPAPGDPPGPADDPFQYETLFIGDRELNPEDIIRCDRFRGFEADPTLAQIDQLFRPFVHIFRVRQLFKSEIGFGFRDLDPLLPAAVILKIHAVSSMDLYNRGNRHQKRIDKQSGAKSGIFRFNHGFEKPRD